MSFALAGGGIWSMALKADGRCGPGEQFHRVSSELAPKSELCPDSDPGLTGIVQIAAAAAEWLREEVDGPLVLGSHIMVSWAATETLQRRRRFRLSGIVFIGRPGGTPSP